jgi:hypothetical protein
MSSSPVSFDFNDDNIILKTGVLTWELDRQKGDLATRRIALDGADEWTGFSGAPDFQLPGEELSAKAATISSEKIPATHRKGAHHACFDSTTMRVLLPAIFSCVGARIMIG